MASGKNPLQLASDCCPRAFSRTLKSQIGDVAEHSAIKTKGSIGQRFGPWHDATERSLILPVLPYSLIVACLSVQAQALS